MSPDDFINWLAPTAQATCKIYNLPASVLIAQGAIESSWGSATIGDFNLFGRKAVDSDKSITVPTQECENGEWVTIDAAFKLYDSLDEACDDWCQLMEWGPYAQYGNQYANDHDVNAFVSGIAGIYATDPDYSTKIMQTINASDLTQYDV